MYQVFTDDIVVYDPRIEDRLISNAKLDIELNKAGSFVFSAFRSNPAFDELRKLKSTIVVKQNGDVIFRGRILNDTDNFYLHRTFTCEGELSFLIDTHQRPFAYTGDVAGLFSQLIANHNKQVGTDRQFKVGRVTVTDPNSYINRSDTEYSTTLELIQSQLLDTLGGYLFFRHETDGVYIDYLADFEKLSNQSIEYGKNLLDLTKTNKGEDIATAVLPLGAKVKLEETEYYTTIESVNQGSDVLVDEEAVADFGYIEKKVVWNDVTEPANLLSKARDYLSESVKHLTSVDVSAVDLADNDKLIDNYRIGTYVPVKTKPHGIDRQMLVTKLSLNLFNPVASKLTLGATYSTYLDMQVKESSEVTRTMTTVATNTNSAVNTVIQIQNNLTVSQGVQLAMDTAYQVVDGNVPQYRQYDKIIELFGTVAPKQAYTSSAQLSRIATLPTEIRPNMRISHVFSDGMNRWLLTADPDGTLAMSCYGAGSFASVPTTARLNFHMIYIVE